MTQQKPTAPKPAKARDHEYDPMVPHEQGEHPLCQVCGMSLSEHRPAKTSE